jgi:hypothetical protein
VLHDDVSEAKFSVVVDETSIGVEISGEQSARHADRRRRDDTRGP